MKFGIVTLVGDNYGNKFQNYAVEQILSKYGEAETFRLERSANRITSINETKTIDKLSIAHVKKFLRSRLMSHFDMNNTEKSVLRDCLYAMVNKNKLLKLKQERSLAFKKYQDEYLNVSDTVLTKELSADENWVHQYDCFFCGSDQVWNPTYDTTSQLAFLSFAKGKSIAIAPSFGVSVIPDDVVDKYKKWLNDILFLSVREDAGAKIISDLTGRDAKVLVDPTMMLDTDAWQECAQKPDTLPQKYLLCYFLGQVNAKYQKAISDFAKKNNLQIVRLFDIESPEYYRYGPNEVLYSILNAEYIFTDSFHGSVFSILFNKNFTVFDRDEGGQSMSSRLDTLLTKFGLQERKFGFEYNDIPASKWNEVESILAIERQYASEYIENAINSIKKKEDNNAI